MKQGIRFVFFLAVMLCVAGQCMAIGLQPANLPAIRRRRSAGC